MAFKNDDPCRDKADDDEPIFTLRAQDKIGPDVVLIWAAIARLQGSPQDKIEDAERVADNMIMWQRAHRARVKVPD